MAFWNNVCCRRTPRQLSRWHSGLDRHLLLMKTEKWLPSSASWWGFVKRTRLCWMTTLTWVSWLKNNDVVRRNCLHSLTKNMHLLEWQHTRVEVSDLVFSHRAYLTHSSFDDARTADKLKHMSQCVFSRYAQCTLWYHLYSAPLW